MQVSVTGFVGMSLVAARTPVKVLMELPMKLVPSSPNAVGGGGVVASGVSGVWVFLSRAHVLNVCHSSITGM